MFARKNALEYVGTSAYIFEQNHYCQKYMFPDLMFRMQCHRNIMHPIFLWLCISQNQRSGIRRLATGYRWYHAEHFKKRLHTMPIICPPIELQSSLQHVLKKYMR